MTAAVPSPWIRSFSRAGVPDWFNYKYITSMAASIVHAQESKKPTPIQGGTHFLKIISCLPSHFKSIFHNKITTLRFGMHHTQLFPLRRYM